MEKKDLINIYENDRQNTIIECYKGFLERNDRELGCYISNGFLFYNVILNDKDFLEEIKELEA